jgi:hypothetical protein
VFESEEQCQDKKEINVYYTYREIQTYVALSFKIVVLLTHMTEVNMQTCPRSKLLGEVHGTWLKVGQEMCLHTLK